MWFLYNRYVFYISIAIIVVIFVYNIVAGNKGTYMDHSRLLLTQTLKELQPPPAATAKKKTGTSLGEEECRRVAEMLTGLPFPKCRPDFLKNTVTNSNLELDCYCQQLGVAIEYNGRQHYEHVPHFHASREAFYNTRYRDEIKADLCRKHGVTLIVVPYTVAVSDIASYLTEKFQTLGVPTKNK